MRTVGEILRQQRQGLSQDLIELAKKLKIKPEHLIALEKDDYRSIPGGMPIIIGILSNYSRVLKLDPVKMSAVFRRDYTGTPGAVLPGELQGKRPSWTPAHTVGSIVLILILLAGAFYYSRSFLLGGPPVLRLDSPKEGELIISDKALIKGRLKRGDIVAVNGEKVLLKEDGSFEVIFDCRPGENLILIEAANPRGEQEQLTRRFTCQEE
ncbi:MAG: helix-turn-helix domain-containing protein [Candidatus Shapirobacteria bacterium]|nr:helix-turn-helix domain-containing protein [Candidatus Shapirobacteria bacterium]